MNNNTLILKIAEGLYDGALEINKVDLIQAELKFFIWNLNKNPELFDYLKSTFNDYKDKCNTLDNLFKDILSNEILHFIKMLLERNFIEYIEDIRKNYDRLANESKNVVEGTIYSPFEIDKERISKMEDIFSSILNKKIILNLKIDSTLICGIKVFIKDKVYDYSIESKLNDVKDKLVKNIK